MCMEQYIEFFLLGSLGTKPSNTEENYTQKLLLFMIILNVFKKTWIIKKI